MLSQHKNASEKKQWIWMIKMYIKFAMLKKIFKQDGKMSETFFLLFQNNWNSIFKAQIFLRNQFFSLINLLNFYSYRKEHKFPRNRLYLLCHKIKVDLLEFRTKNLLLCDFANLSLNLPKIHTESIGIISFPLKVSPLNSPF